MIKTEIEYTGTNQLTLEKAKGFLRVDFTQDDDLITDLIEQARELMERTLGLSIIEATITLSATPRAVLELPYKPVKTITSVKDQDGVDLTYTWNGFYIVFEATTFRPTQPEAGSYVDTVTIYDSGYDSTNIPAGLLLGWMQVVAWLYENRGDDSGFRQVITQNENLKVYRTKVWI